MSFNKTRMNFSDINNQRAGETKFPSVLQPIENLGFYHVSSHQFMAINQAFSGTNQI